MDHVDDFYEDDEPIEDVIASFGPGPHPVTQRPLPAHATVVSPVDSYVGVKTAAGPQVAAFSVIRTRALTSA